MRWQVAGRRMAGRRLANKPISLRSPRIACSGRSARRACHTSSRPLRAKSTASEAFASLRVDGGSGGRVIIRGATDRRPSWSDPGPARPARRGLFGDLVPITVAGSTAML